MSTSSDRGLFVWHDVGTNDLQAGEAFYGKVAGWKVEDWNQNPSYKLFVARREQKAGLYLTNETPNTLTPPPSWLSYIGTPDVDATVRQAVELGGKVLVSAYNVPSVGRMAHLQDRRVPRSPCRRSRSARATKTHSSAIFRGTSS